MPRPLRHYKIPAGGEFGAVRAGGARTHQGTDYHPLDNKDGEPIYGTADGGVVTYIGYDPDPTIGAGHNVTVAYLYDNRTTRDCHMRETTTLKVGSRVDATTLIGYVGHTGNAVNAQPAGSHDHHEVRIGGVLVDPEKYYAAEPATAGGGAPVDLNQEEDDMLKPKVIKRTEGTEEWSLCAPWLAKPGDKLQQGYIVTDNKDVATAWARLYDLGIGNETKGNRAEYIAMQGQAREIRKQYLADLTAAAKGNAAALAAELAKLTPAATTEQPVAFPKGFTGQFTN